MHELMDWLRWAIDVLLHLDKHLNEMVASVGLWSYAILFAIVFCETGLVVTPFLPGDSLLFACGALAASENAVLDPWLLFISLTLAAIIGDTVNYHIGKYIGPKIFHRPDSRWLKKEHLQRTHQFYEKHGGKTIILARFIPIIRTFAPFVAGIGAMSYMKFLAYNVIGAIAWVGGFLFLGYYFGNMPLVKKNFTLVILAIIILSVLPAVFEFLRARKESRAAKSSSAEQK